MIVITIFTVFTLASCKFYPFILQTLILTGPLVIAVTPLLKRLSCINMVYYYYHYYLLESERRI